LMGAGGRGEGLEQIVLHHDAHNVAGADGGVERGQAYGLLETLCCG
jgi:hypothetical protein